MTLKNNKNITKKKTKKYSKINSKILSKKSKKSNHNKYINKKRSIKKNENNLERHKRRKTRLKQQSAGLFFKKTEIDPQQQQLINEKLTQIIREKIKELSETIQIKDGEGSPLEIKFLNTNGEEEDIENVFRVYPDLDNIKKTMKIKLISNNKRIKFKTVKHLFKDIYIKIKFEVTSSKKKKIRAIYYTLYDFYKNIKNIRPTILDNFIEEVEFIDKKIYKKNTLSTAYKRWLTLGITHNAYKILKTI